ncbi:MAG: putative bifunctional diguanylate cyclase/phosphodiesterase [Acidimicrobiales bacterium]
MSQAADPALPGEQRGADVDAEHLRALLADTADLAAVLDAEGQLRYLNRAGRRLLVLSTELTGRPLSAFEVVAAADLRVLEVDVFPALHLDGWWSGNLTLVTETGAEVPTRSTLRLHGAVDGATPQITWVARDISTEKAVYERLHKKIFEDELTGLPHRSIFLDRLDLSLRRSPGDDAPVALLFVSIDRFKEKNDRFGREVGDLLLRSVAERLDRLRGPTDTLSRWGGDEFVFMSEGNGTKINAEALAARILSSFEEPFLVGTTEVFLSASVGVSTAPAGDVGTDQLLRQADAAGQMAKQRGGATVHHYDSEMQARAHRRAEVEDALRGATERNELVLHFQPEVSLRTNQIVAVEALVRWQHPDWGLVAPGEFVSVAENSNLILELGTWVLANAMRQCAQWHAGFGPSAPTVAINISARQFLQDDFVELVATTLERTGADPGDICLEITESILMDDVDLTVATLRRLKALGVQLAVDDFGTGYSSLSYLRRFPVDVLKVDQSFVSGLGHDPEDSAIVQAVVAMGRALQLTTVAEGVETAHHLIELRELDCDLAQGYHFARPRPAEAISRMLEAGPDWMLVTL